MKFPFWCALSCMVGLSGGVVIAGPDIDSVQKSAREWAQMRAETVRLQTDWQWQRQLLASTNVALQERIAKLETERDQLKAATSTDRNDIDELSAKNRASTESIAKAEERLKAVTTKLLALRPSLPPRLSEALELPYRSLANPALTPGERMLYVTTILNRCAQFNKSITYVEEPVALPGQAERKLLNVIYWGLGQGYALDRVSGKAYVGAPVAEGWKWEENPKAAEPLARVIAIHQEKADPDFVELPARLAHLATLNAR